MYSKSVIHYCVFQCTVTHLYVNFGYCARAPFNELTSIPAWMNNHAHDGVLRAIIYPFPNFNGCAVEVWEWIINFMQHFIMAVTTYPSWGTDLSSSFFSPENAATVGMLLSASVATLPAFAYAASSRRVSLVLIWGNTMFYKNKQ